MPADPIPVDSIALEDVDLDPRFVARVPDPQDHASYLEAFHESTNRSLAALHLRAAKGDLDGVTEGLRELRLHLDALWEQRAQAARRQVAP